MNLPSATQLHNALSCLRRQVELILQERASGQSPLSASLAFASLKRAGNVLDAIETVAAKGLASEVRTLGRVICESVYNATWILELQGKDRSSQEREEKAQWLFDQSVLEGAKITRSWARHDFATQVDADKATVAESEIRKRRGMKPKDKLDKPNLYDRAKECGPALIEAYDLFYRAMCLDAHSSVQGMIWALEGPREHALELNLFMVVAVTLQLLNPCSQLIGRTDFHEVQKEVEVLLGLPIASLSP